MKMACNFLFFSVFIILDGYCHAFGQSATFNFTGTLQTYTVPAGAYYLCIEARGARGGDAGPAVAGTVHAAGGRVQANLAVSPGQILNINVGGYGADADGITTALGGYNGGGNVAIDPVTGNSGGGGGGMTNIYTGTTQLIVAGGAGGAGYDGTCTVLFMPGGVGGGLTGGAGVHCASTTWTVTNAGGGAQSAGGVGGDLCCGTWTAGNPGSAGIGGDNVSGGGSGGGGGAGYYGGGGGCWMGGGGGSSYTNPAYTSDVTHTQGYNDVDGVVFICVLPDPGIISGTASICPGVTTALTTTGISGGTWSSSNISIASVNATGVAAGGSEGTDTISYAVTNSCGTIASTLVVTIDPLPDAGTITGKDTVCPNHTVTLSDAVSGGTWSSSDPAVSAVSGTGVVTGLSAGTTTITYSITSGGCTGTATHSFYVPSVAVCDERVNTVTSDAAGIITIIPNPGPGTFAVNLSSPVNEQAHFIITNIIGEKIKEFTGSTNMPITMQLDVPDGVYFLNVSTLHGIWTKKVIVTR
jgi:hypothetical protein